MVLGGWPPGTPAADSSRFVRRTVRIVILAATFMLVGCATSPGSDVVTPRERVTRRDALRLTNEGLVTIDTLPAPPSSTYRALVRSYQALEIPVTAVMDAEHRLETENVEMNRIDGERMSRFLDCGQGVSGPRADSHVIAIRLLSSVTSTADGGSRLEMEFDGTAWPRLHAGSPIHCSSTRALETRLREEVRRRTGGAGD